MYVILYIISKILVIDVIYLIIQNDWSSNVDFKRGMPNVEFVYEECTDTQLKPLNLHKHNRYVENA